MSLTLVITIFLIKSSVGSIENCSRSDSISCLQLQFYKISNEYLKYPIEFGGFILRDNGALKARNFDDENEQTITSTRDVAQRQRALQDYLINRIRYLWSRGSIVWQPLKTIKSFIDLMPNVIRNGVEEGRSEGGRKMKSESKFLSPLLIGVMLKLASLAAIFYMVVAVIAKKAVIAAVISFLVSLFISVKNLIQTKHENFLTPYQQYYSYEHINPYQYQQHHHPVGFQQDSAIRHGIDIKKQ